MTISTNSIDSGLSRTSTWILLANRFSVGAAEQRGQAGFPVADVLLDLAEGNTSGGGFSGDEVNE